MGDEGGEDGLKCECKVRREEGEEMGNEGGEKKNEDACRNERRQSLGVDRKQTRRTRASD